MTFIFLPRDRVASFPNSRILVYKICRHKIQDRKLLLQAVNICKFKAKFDKENSAL